ncbi:rod shape-determining protein MreC [Octadecabacter sp. 1_MG-2023]|uniref:rod shape-determining protein MreC n=1 Tax=unclassified Octadecabacter TaxID=196158 RepID=UPI001C0A489C|nr:MULTISPECIES: rod shape-determining protein MreC [unclassified Octadecabacter]MBU2994437.1 rod shape-determining protein MreC [Octadecabacter sp. B2R22]MDO6734272.1 rod shape-determining protein MreC [Octadecabacter sp. 1_MG-2023]
MARDRQQKEDYVNPVRRLLVGVLVLFLLGTFLIWRIDNPRVERFRMMVIDAVVPSFDWAMAPVTGIANLLSDFQSYQRLAQQNVDLRRELQDMKSWREAAIQLDQENARLRELINVQLDPQLTRITGVVMADSGSPYRQSVLLNVGSRDGILDGWPAMDGIGLVGRISGVGEQTSRVILVTDTSSQIPVTIQPSGQRAILSGDNTINPLLQFIEDSDLVKPGDRVVTSGDGGVFPADLPVGQLARGTDGRMRTRLSADLERLEFLRVLRSQPAARIEEAGSLLAPLFAPVSTEETEADDGSGDGSDG